MGMLDKKGHHISISASSPILPPQPLFPAPFSAATTAFFWPLDVDDGSGFFMMSELPACWRIVAHGLALNDGWARICGVRSASA